jgi:hypothetical protein
MDFVKDQPSSLAHRRFCHPSAIKPDEFSELGSDVHEFIA